MKGQTKATAGMTIACHGDSLTEGAEVEGAYRWTTLLGNRLGCRVINTGIGGDTTAGLLARFYADVIRHRPAAVILLGGTNDLWWDLDIPFILSNLFTMACQAQYHQVAPVIGLPLPLCIERAARYPMMGPRQGFEKCVQELGRLIEAVKVAAKESEIPVLDLHGLFCHPDGRVRSEYYLEDGLHPNQAGHRLMAGEAAERLREWFMLG